MHVCNYIWLESKMIEKKYDEMNRLVKSRFLISIIDPFF